MSPRPSIPLSSIGAFSRSARWTLAARIGLAACLVVALVAAFFVTRHDRRGDAALQSGRRPVIALDLSWSVSFDKSRQIEKTLRGFADSGRRLGLVLFSDTASNLRRPGETTTHHTLTHEEPEDKALGYQKEHSWFATNSMVAWKDFLDAIAAIPEGDGTLLDNSLILAHSDCSIAKSHAVEGIPAMVAGNAGGAVRTGYHLAGNGDSIARLGLTIQQAADTLGISHATAERHWAYAKAWLYRELARSGHGPAQ